jgi:uncharacterized BrkB/YihY/UPF0761 family membrane protein
LWLPDQKSIEDKRKPNAWPQIILTVDLICSLIVITLLFTLVKWAIGLYVGRVAMASMYGAASSMAILVWVYYSALIFFLGAESTYVMRMSTARARLTGEASQSAALRPKTGHEPASSLVLS